MYEYCGQPSNQSIRVVRSPHSPEHYEFCENCPCPQVVMRRNRRACAVSGFMSAHPSHQPFYALYIGKLRNAHVRWRWKKIVSAQIANPRAYDECAYNGTIDNSCWLRWFVDAHCPICVAHDTPLPQTALKGDSVRWIDSLSYVLGSGAREKTTGSTSAGDGPGYRWTVERRRLCLIHIIIWLDL